MKLSERTEKTTTPVDADSIHIVSGGASFFQKVVNYFKYLIPSAETGTAWVLDRVTGRLYNMASANSGTTYTFTGSTANAYAKGLINASTEPTVTGATKIAGSDFEASTDMYLTLWYNGTRAEYWFEAI